MNIHRTIPDTSLKNPDEESEMSALDTTHDSDSVGHQHEHAEVSIQKSGSKKKRRGVRRFFRRKRKEDKRVQEETPSPLPDVAEEEVQPSIVDLDEDLIDSTTDDDVAVVPENFSVFGYVQPLKHVKSKWSVKREVLEYRWEDDYKQVFLGTEESEELVSRHMKAANHVLDELRYIQQYSRNSLFPDSVLESVFWVLEEFLWPRVVRFNTEVFGGMAPGEAAKLVKFIHEFSITATEIDPSFKKKVLEFRWSTQVPLDFYLKGVQNDMDQIIEQIAMIYTNDENLRRTKDNQFVSDLSTQLTYLLENQISVMTEALPSAYQHLVLDGCFTEVSRLAGAILQIIRSPSYLKQAEAHQFCALVNDCEAVVGVIEGAFSPGEPSLVDSLAALWTQLALTAIALLVDHIMNDTHREDAKLLSVIGSGEEWSCVGERLCATFSDYFGDLPGWIVNDNYFLPKILRESFDRCIHDYLTCFFEKTMASGLKDSSKAGDCIRSDWEALLDYFATDTFVAGYHGVAGFYSTQEIRDELEILRNVANLVDPSVSPELAQTDVNAVQWSFDSAKRGSPTVLHLVGIRFHHRLTTEESVRWLQAVANAKRILADINRDKEILKIGQNSRAAPHIRDSRFIRNVQMGFRVRAKLSRTTLVHLDSTRRLKNESSGVKLFGMRRKGTSRSR